MESDKTSRFCVSDKQKACYEETEVNKNTKKSTATWLSTYLEWANERKKPKSIENLSPKDLDGSEKTAATTSPSPWELCKLP